MRTLGETYDLGIAMFAKHVSMDGRICDLSLGEEEIPSTIMKNFRKKLDFSLHKSVVSLPRPVQPTCFSISPYPKKSPIR